ncbi:MAG: ATP-binding protein [Steroidobacteraceae bacterium]
MDDLSSITRHLLQFSPDALIVIDTRGIVRFANATTGALFGYTPEQVVGQSVEMLVPERFRIRHGAHVLGYLRDPTSREMGARMADLFARRADGSEFPAGIRLAPFYDGGKTYVAAAIRDMTDRRAIVDALIAAREEADRANLAKTRFLATASHDLRQPLQTIRLFNASMLALTAGIPEVRDLLLRQQLAIDGTSRMLNSLLDVTRLESGAIEPQLAPVGLAAVLADLAREFEPAAATKNLRLEFADTQAVITTDRTLFIQLLQNLIGNALKYTESGFVRVALSAEAAALILTVEDSGIGIPEEKLERIFDEYYQVDRKGAPRSGVGLGLAIVREVSRLLGYSITVASHLGEGTRVRVRIPRQPVSSQLPAPRPEAAEPARADGDAVKTAPAPRCRVVLLEDNDSVRTATELFLSLEGYETHSAASVAEAESLLAGMQPGDVFISDYHLEGALTGLDVLQQLRARGDHLSELPAILLSGDLPSMMRAMKGSIPRCRFLGKPVDTQALLTALAELGGNAHPVS